MNWSISTRSDYVFRLLTVVLAASSLFSLGHSRAMADETGNLSPEAVAALRKSIERTMERQGIPAMSVAVGVDGRQQQRDQW